MLSLSNCSVDKPASKNTIIIKKIVLSCTSDIIKSRFIMKTNGLNPGFFAISQKLIFCEASFETHVHICIYHFIYTVVVIVLYR